MIILEERLDEFSAFFILAFDDNIRIIRLIVEHADCVIRFMCTEGGFLFSKSETEMGFIRTLNDMFEEIVFSVTLIFNVLQDEVLIEIVGNQHKFLVRTVGREGLERIFKIRHIRFVENAVSEVTLFIKFVGVEEP